MSEPLEDPPAATEGDVSAPAAPPDTIGGRVRDARGKFTPKAEAPVPNGADPAPAEGDVPRETPPTADIRRWELNFGDLPPELRSWAEKFDSPATALKSHRELESRLGKSVLLPGPKATPDEIAKFRKALGVPDDPSGYQIEIAAEELDEQTEEWLGRIAGKMHAVGSPPATVQAAVEIMGELMNEGVQAHEAQVTEQRQAALEELQRDWPGQEFTRNGVFANRAISQFDDDGSFVKFLDQTEVGGGKLSNHPTLVRLFAKIGRAMSEGTAELAPTEGEIDNINAEIRKIRERKEAARRAGDHRRAQELDQAERDLYAMRGARGEIVGSGGRTA